MIFVRIDDQLRLNTKAPQCLVHLLAALDGDVKVALATQKKRRRFDPIRMQKRVRDFLIRLPRLRLPRRADLVIVLKDVLVRSVKCDGKRRAGPARPGLESRVAGDHIIGQYTAVTPAAHTQFVRIGDAHFDNVIDTGKQVLDFVVPPIGGNRPRKFLTASRTAPIVYGQNGVSVSRKELTFSVE